MFHEAVFFFLNWVAPCTIRNPVKETQAAVAGNLVSTNSNSIGLVMCPEFVYKKGSLWLAETAAIRQLALSGANIDRTFAMSFREKAHPLVSLVCDCGSAVCPKL